MVLIPLGVLFATMLAVPGDPSIATFDRYPAGSTSVRKAAAPLLTGPLSHRFRSALREAAHLEPNFAGHYVLARIGCGAGCLRLAAIDRISGGIAWFPATISGWPLNVTQPLAFRRDSRLLVVQGMLDEREPTAKRRYMFDGVRFLLLR